MKRITIRIFILICASCILFPLASQPVMPEIFSDNMVLQQNSRVAIWGTTGANSQINVVAEWLDNPIVVNSDLNGNFLIRLQTLSADKNAHAYKLSLEDKTGVVEYKNIVFGEVWLAGGQSNMALELKKSKDGSDYIKNSDNDNLRFYYTPHKYYEGEKPRERGQWVTTNPENVGRFSAVAYHFAMQLQQRLQVPVGVILCYKGGTPAESWMSKDFLINNGFDSVYTFFNNRIPDDYENEYQKYLSDNKKYKELEKQGLVPATKPSEPYGWRNYKRPDGLHTLMFKPLQPYTVTGFLWYQGEANAMRAEQYKKLFPALIAEWREEFQVPDAPFLFVQLPNYAHPSYNYPAWANLREAQLETSQKDTNTAMAVIVDIGDKNDIHPLDKEPVGHRLFLAAMALKYHEKIVYRSPEVLNISKNKDNIIITFDLFGSEGLSSNDNGTLLKNFEFIYENGKSLSVKAEIIDKNKVEIYGEVEKISEIRYAWANYFEANFTNKEGLFISPFRIKITSK
ncbi:9-O-acetylesterase [Bacteroidia bacterium]|nr:9-O-acetylesterase [Bacteroidia bacterium]